MKQKFKLTKVAGVTTAVVVSTVATTANAALDAGISTLLDGLEADFALLFAAISVLWLAIKGPSVMMSLANKFIRKAAAG